MKCSCKEFPNEICLHCLYNSDEIEEYVDDFKEDWGDGY